MRKTLIILFSILIGFMLVLGVLNLIFGTETYGYAFDGHMMPGGMMGFGFIGMLLFWGFIIFLVLSLTENNGPFNRDKSYSSLSSREILDKKYVRGDISEEEYKKKKRTLNDDGNHNA